LAAEACAACMVQSLRRRPRPPVAGACQADVNGAWRVPSACQRVPAARRRRRSRRPRRACSAAWARSACARRSPRSSPRPPTRWRRSSSAARRAPARAGTFQPVVGSGCLHTQSAARPQAPARKSWQRSQGAVWRKRRVSCVRLPCRECAAADIGQLHHRPSFLWAVATHAAQCHSTRCIAASSARGRPCDKL